MLKDQLVIATPTDTDWSASTFALRQPLKPRLLKRKDLRGSRPTLGESAPKTRTRFQPACSLETFSMQLRYFVQLPIEDKGSILRFLGANKNL